MEKRYADGKLSNSAKSSPCSGKSDQTLVKDFFLAGMACVYMFAFASLFVQIPGLYGDNGIQPAKLAIKAAPASLGEMLEQVSILRLLPGWGIKNTRLGMDLLCLLGAILSFLAFIIPRLRQKFLFFSLWFLYLSLFQVGQTFLWFQWDTLLLEAGFLTILVAPLGLCGYTNGYTDRLGLWLVKWLGFRLMFASGVVKLTSGCPTWWGLTAMNYHYESQCIPTPMAWYFHQLPLWFQRLSVVGVYVIEIALPFLFFSPVRSQRLFSAFMQVMLMLVIALTGNYNFFNLITCVLFISLLDDDWMERWTNSRKQNKPSTKDKSKSSVSSSNKSVSCGRTLWLVRLLFNITVYGSLIYWTCHLFHIRVNNNNMIFDTKIVFNNEDLSWFLARAVPLSIWIGIISLAIEILSALIRIIMSKEGSVRRLVSLFGCVFVSVSVILLFCISLVPYTYLENTTHQALPSTIKHWHHSTSNTLQLSHSYGLFRSMTGVGGRPEVVLEGSDSMEGGWREYNFLYKAGDVARKPPVVAPHQPRLDWQMWFAALGDYEHNPWFLNLVYRLLKNEKDVVALIDKGPFDGAAPKYIRAQLYHYHYTTLNETSSDWWTRNHVRQYLPIVWDDEPGLVNYLKNAKIYQDPQMKDSTNENDCYMLRKLMDSLHSLVSPADGFNVCMAMFASAVIYKIIKGWFSS